MAYHEFTTAQRATIEALVAEMRDNAALWVDVELSSAHAWSTKAEMIADLAGDWVTEGTFCRPADFIKTLRETVRKTRRPQAEIFAAIRELGFAVRKIDGGEIRVSRPLRLNASVEARRRAEDQAAYCSDLGEALATAMQWAASLQAEREARAQRAAESAERIENRRAAAVEAVATYEALADQLGDPHHLANAREHRDVLDDPRGVFDLEATLYAIEQVRDLLAERNRCPDRAPACSAPNLDHIAQLVAAAKAARFALESACYLQGLKALAPYVLQLTDALEAFEPVEASAEAQMRAAALAGRPDLSA